jgi:hypothetical protein
MAHFRWRRAIVLAALPAALALPAAAPAAEVSLDPVLTYQAATGETNRPQVSVLGADYVVRDATPGLILRAGPGCRVVSTTEVRCRRQPGTQLIDLRLGDRDDHGKVSVADVQAIVRGEAGSDIYFGGTAPGVSRVDFRGGGEIDLASYSLAGTFVRVKKDEDAADGRAGDRDNVRRDVENLLGSSFDDTLVGWGNPVGTQESFDGAAGDDFMAGLGGDDQFEMRAAPDGADAVRGGDGRDYADYFSRTTPVFVTLDHGDGHDDGARFEGDDIDEIEEIAGGRAGDTIEAPVASTTEFHIYGHFGDDRLTGGSGDDEIYGEILGGDGEDAINGRAGDDYVYAHDNAPEFIDCGTGFDVLDRDRDESVVLHCEDQDVLGTLRMSRRVRAEAGEPAALRVRWKHPSGWRKLKEIELRLRAGAQSAGEVSIRPRAGRISGDGVKLVRSRLSRDGKWVSAKLVLRLGDHLAGETLTADVEAVDVRGRRQVESRAARIEVAR